MEDTAMPMTLQQKRDMLTAITHQGAGWWHEYNEESGPSESEVESWVNGLSENQVDARLSLTIGYSGVRFWCEAESLTIPTVEDVYAALADSGSERRKKLINDTADAYYPPIG